MADNKKRGFVIRPICAADLCRVAQAHSMAFHDTFLTKLGRGAVTRYYESLLGGPYKQRSVVAVSEDAVTGYCFSGIFSGATTSFLKKNLFYLCLQLLRRPGLLLTRMFFKKALTGTLLILGVNKKKNPSGKEPPAYRILAIAVLPESQGSGAAKELMEHCEQAAREMGYDRIGLTVKRNNARAIRFYEKRAYRDDGSSEKSEYMSMEKDL